MCGRAAQSVHLARGARHVLQPDRSTAKQQQDRGGQQRSAGEQQAEPRAGSDATATSDEVPRDTRDNFKLSPGMDAALFKEDGKLQMDRKVWGLVTKGGTKQYPLPGRHWQRTHATTVRSGISCTILEPTHFFKLLAQKRSCVVVLDGYFAWEKSLIAGKGKKSTYFVYRDGTMRAHCSRQDCSRQDCATEFQQV